MPASNMQILQLLMMLLTFMNYMYPIYSSAIEGIDCMQLLPSTVVSVCSEERLSLICCSNVSHALRWMVILNDTMPYSRLISSTGLIPSLPIEIANRTVTINFLRQSTDPLISTLSIDNVITELNGTRITCSTANASETTVIHVINAHHAFLEIRETASFQKTNVTVNLDWTQEVLASYNAHIFPQVLLTRFTNNTSIHLIVPYNTPYNVSITAYLCGQNVSTDIELLYSATCGYPLQKLRSVSNTSNSVIYMGPRFPITEGASINFSCPFEYVLSGPNSTVCTKNGQWYPDPQGVNCIKACRPPSPPPNGYISAYIRTSKGYMWLKFVCQNDTSTAEEPMISHCSVEGRWSPDPEEFCSKNTVQRSQIILQVTIASSVYILISSILFLVTCVICGCYNLKQKKNVQSLTSRIDIYNQASDSVATVPTFGLQDTTHSSYQDQDLELTENVAYDTYRPTAP